MKEAIGGSWLFNIVIFFVILFTGYLCLSINHTKAFNVKDDIVKIIERNNGFKEELNNVNASNNVVIKEIVESLQKFGYRSTSKCPDADGGQFWYGYDRDGNRDNGNNNSSFCIREVDATSGLGGAKTVYYQVVVFYQLDLPIVNSIFGFKLKGDTRLIYNK